MDGETEKNESKYVSIYHRWINSTFFNDFLYLLYTTLTDPKNLYMYTYNNSRNRKFNFFFLCWKDITATLSRLNDLPTEHGFPAGSKFYVFQEVIDQNDGAIKVDEYYNTGIVWLPMCEVFAQVRHFLTRYLLSLITRKDTWLNSATALKLRGVSRTTANWATWSIMAGVWPVPTEPSFLSTITTISAAMEEAVWTRTDIALNCMVTFIGGNLMALLCFSTQIPMDRQCYYARSTTRLQTSCGLYSRPRLRIYSHHE